MRRGPREQNLFCMNTQFYSAVGTLALFVAWWRNIYFAIGTFDFAIGTFCFAIGTLAIFQRLEHFISSLSRGEKNTPLQRLEHSAKFCDRNIFHVLNFAKARGKAQRLEHFHFRSFLIFSQAPKPWRNSSPPPPSTFSLSLLSALQQQPRSHLSLSLLPPLPSIK